MEIKNFINLLLNQNHSKSISSGSLYWITPSYSKSIFFKFINSPGGSRRDVYWRCMTVYDIRNLRFWYISPPFPHHMNSENRPFMTIKEVSELLGISISTINRLVKTREFPPKRKISPRRKVFMKYQIQEWIDNRRSDW